MPAIRNSSLIKRFTDFFKLKTTDMLDSEAGRMLVPVITEPVPKNIIQISDVIVNDSDKSLTVPSGKQWKVLYGHILFITTATVGDRRISLQIIDENNNIIYIVEALNVQAASLTERYTFGQFGDVSESVGNRHLIPIPHDTILPENFDLRVFDIGAVDATADDLIVRMIVEEIDVTGE